MFIWLQKIISHGIVLGRFFVVAKGLDYAQRLVRHLLIILQIVVFIEFHEPT